MKPTSRRLLALYSFADITIQVLWFFNFILSITFPALEKAFTTSGAFGWYAGWCAALFVLAFLFVPETKMLTLEELDQGEFKSVIIAPIANNDDSFQYSYARPHCLPDEASSLLLQALYSTSQDRERAALHRG